MKDYKLNETQEDKEEASEEEAHSTIHFSLPQDSSEKNLRTVAVLAKSMKKKVQILHLVFIIFGKMRLSSIQMRNLKETKS